MTAVTSNIYAISPKAKNENLLGTRILPSADLGRMPKKNFCIQNFIEMCCFLGAFRDIIPMCAWHPFLVRLFSVAQF